MSVLRHTVHSFPLLLTTTASHTCLCSNPFWRAQWKHQLEAIESITALQTCPWTPFCLTGIFILTKKKAPVEEHLWKQTHVNVNFKVAQTKLTQKEQRDVLLHQLPTTLKQNKFKGMHHFCEAVSYNFCEHVNFKSLLHEPCLHRLPWHPLYGFWAHWWCSLHLQILFELNTVRGTTCFLSAFLFNFGNRHKWLLVVKPSRTTSEFTIHFFFSF